MVAQLLDNQHNTIDSGEELEKVMLDHLKWQKEVLISRGISPFYGEVEDGEMVLSWTDENRNRYSLSLWLDDYYAFISTVQGAKVIDKKSYSSNDFLNFHV